MFAHESDAPELLGCLAYVFSSLSAPEVFSVPAKAFLGLVEGVREAMTVNEVPYHNFHHAVDVTQVWRCAVKHSTPSCGFSAFTNSLVAWPVTDNVLLAHNHESKRFLDTLGDVRCHAFGHVP